MKNKQLHNRTTRNGTILHANDSCQNNATKESLQSRPAAYTRTEQENIDAQHQE